MLGYLVIEGRGAADRLLFGLAQRLRDDGWPLAGAVQSNAERGDALRCDMDLHVLAAHAVVRISQNLGTHSSGCRLDPGALAHAVGLAEAALSNGARLCIVNKFGKAETEGHGFRPMIAAALGLGIPVLTSVSRGHLSAFLAFAEGMAEEIAPREETLLDWCRAQTGGLDKMSSTAG